MSKIKVRVTGIKKGDRFWNEYWDREVIAATDAYRLDGTVDPENYHATKPKPKVGVCHWNGTEWIRDWWMIEVGINDGKGAGGGWSEVEHRYIEVERAEWTESDERRYAELREAASLTREGREELAELRQRR